MVYDRFDKERLFFGHSGTVFTTLTGIFIAIKLAQRLVPPLLPAVIEDLSISTFLAGMALTILLLSRAIMQFPGGRVADEISRTSTIIGSLGIIILSLVVLSIAFTYAFLILGLVLFGTGLAVFTPASRALLSDVYQEKRGRAFGIHTMGSDIAGLLAAGTSIWIVAEMTWRSAFIPILVLLVPMLGVFHFISRESTSLGPVSLELRGTLTRLLGDSYMRWLLVTYSLYVMASRGVLGFLPTFLMEFHNVTFAVASSSFAIVFGVGIIMKPASGYISDVLPKALVGAGALLVTSLGVAVLTFASLTGVVIVGVIVYAMGQRALTPALQSHLMDQFPDQNMGGDFGATRSVYMGLGSLGPVYVGYVADVLGFGYAIASLIPCFLLGAIVLLRFQI